MLRSRLIYFLALLCASLFYIFYDGWAAEYLLLLLLVLPVIVLLMSLPAMLTTEVSFTVKEILYRNCDEDLLLTVQSRYPITGCTLRCRCVDRRTGKIMTQTLPFDARSDRDERIDGGGYCRIYRIPLPTEHCGSFFCRINQIHITDFIGLCSLSCRSPIPQSFTVYPEELPEELISSEVETEEGTLIPKSGGGFSEYYELREYRAGDPVRFIHWKLSGKTDRLIVREAMASCGAPICITYDLPLAAEQADGVFESLTERSCALLREGKYHVIRGMDFQTRQYFDAEIRSLADLKELLTRLMTQSQSYDLRWPAEKPMDSTIRHYHIGCQDKRDERMKKERRLQNEKAK